MIGIICAMDVELEKILTMMENEQGDIVSGIVFHRGTIGGKDAVCVVCGVGKVFAAMCTQTMILKYAPDCIINVGVAGALDKHLQITDIVVADDLVHYDMDVTALRSSQRDDPRHGLYRVPNGEECVGSAVNRSMR